MERFAWFTGTRLSPSNLGLNVFLFLKKRVECRGNQSYRNHGHIQGWDVLLYTCNALHLKGKYVFFSHASGVVIGMATLV